MSFADKLSSLMARPGEDPVAKDDVPWWLRYMGRGLGTVGGFIAIFLGVWNCVSVFTLNTSCVLSGIWQIVAGFATLCIEAPCCCLFVEYVQTLSDWVDKKPYWHRAAGYMLISLPAIFFCIGLSSIFGSGLIFATGVVYGMMALGRKASSEDMRTAAVAETAPKTTSMHSNLVTNAQPLAFTGAPVYDSNV